jgi:hypothetical protein
MVVIVNDVAEGDSNYVFFGQIDLSIKSELEQTGVKNKDVYYYPKEMIHLFNELLKKNAVCNLFANPFNYTISTSKDYKLFGKIIGKAEMFMLEQIDLNFIGRQSDISFNKVGVYLKMSEIDSKLLYKDKGCADENQQFYEQSNGRIALDYKLWAKPLQVCSKYGLLY